MSNKYREEQEAPENSERWLLTYADLITLLLIFFIVMYTMAKVDVAKYEAVKDSLAGALKGGSSNIKRGNEGILQTPVKVPKDGTGAGEGTEAEKMESIESKVEELVKKYNLEQFIIVTSEERGLDIEIRNELLNIVLFESGSSELGSVAGEIISKIGLILKELPDNYIRVEGHTDNRPINNKTFKSNWELSTSRATNVLKLLINSSGLNPEKLSAVGYGEYKPVATNNTVEGRAKNRRVNIVIIKKKYDLVETKQ